VDPYELAYRFGRDLRFIGPEFQALLFCSACGSRNIAVKIIPDYSRMGRDERKRAPPGWPAGPGS
jgi:hypothetical protein